VNNFFISVYNLQTGHWDDGRGIENFGTQCDYGRLFARHISGGVVLDYPNAGYAHNTGDFSGPFTHWAGNYVIKYHKRHEADCWYKNNGATLATTFRGLPFDNDRTEFYLSYFNTDPVFRAGTLVHESRHGEGVGHDAGNLDSSWTYFGAYYYEVVWYAWYVVDGSWGTKAMRQRARDLGNSRLASMFVIPPPYKMPAVTF
jgi:hypothetical protein